MSYQIYNHLNKRILEAFSVLRTFWFELQRALWGTLCCLSRSSSSLDSLSTTILVTSLVVGTPSASVNSYSTFYCSQAFVKGGSTYFSWTLISVCDRGNCIPSTAICCLFVIVTVTCTKNRSFFFFSAQGLNPPFTSSSKPSILVSFYRGASLTLSVNEAEVANLLSSSWLFWPFFLDKNAFWQAGTFSLLCFSQAWSPPVAKNGIWDTSLLSLARSSRDLSMLMLASIGASSTGSSR